MQTRIRVERRNPHIHKAPGQQVRRIKPIRGPGPEGGKQG